MPRMILQIPKYSRKGLARLVRSEDEEIKAVFEALTTAKPCLKMADLAAEVAAKAGLPQDDVKEMLGAIGGLYLLLEREGTTVDSIVDAAADAVQATDDPLLKMDGPHLGRLKERLRQGLAFPQNLGITAKALDVVSEQGRLYCSARVLTDIRPVFPVRSEEAPAGYVLTHTLKVRCHREDDHEEVFVVMDASDVQELIAILERAKRKERALKATLARQGLPVLEGGHD